MSSLAILTVVVSSPRTVGAKVIWNVVDPLGATGVVGCDVTEKSAALPPVIEIFGVPVRSSSPVPEFWMVNVRAKVPAFVRTLPKSV